jgi:hypothetical protein
MNIVVSIRNDTDYTPYLTTVAVQGAVWVHTQSLDPNQPIAPRKRIVGLLDATLPFSATIVVRYTFVAPGPNGADVRLTLDGRLLDGKPLLSWNITSDPANAFPGCDVLSQEEDGDRYVLYTIA